MALERAILTTRITRTARRFFGVPDFRYCAPADGIAVVIRRVAR